MVAANFVSAVGQRFGRLLVVSEGTGKKRRVVAQCDCGTTKEFTLSTLRSGSTKSCGCLRRNRLKKHGHASHPSYQCWVDMIRRCENPKCKAYKHYGGRGIKVCERWRWFELFAEDMGERPSGLELDRIDNDGDYCKENCRWASRTEQLRNQRRTTAIEIGGETKSITEWAVYFGVVSASVASGRIRYGWEPRKAFTTPLRGKS